MNLTEIIGNTNNELAQLILQAKTIALYFSVVLAAIAVYFIIQFQKLVQQKMELTRLLLRTPEAASGGGVISRWGEIVRHFESVKEAEWKFAIIEADKLVDDLLKQGGYLGDTMGERLMNIEKGQLLSLQGLWEAHKIRNKLVHDTNYFLRYTEARQAIKFYEEALKELGTI
ncbi:MAG: hypothetical protein Q8Q89_00120 [bacterium]|nr:hypothetical protein [bacterium]